MATKIWAKWESGLTTVQLKWDPLVYEWTFRKGQVFSTQPYCMYILVNSGDLRIKLDFYYMRTCVPFTTAKTATNKVNVTFQHETWCQELQMCLSLSDIPPEKELVNIYCAVRLLSKSF